MKRKEQKEYFVWKNMRARCKHDIHYVNNGISVCKRWDDYDLFLSDMGERPSDNHSIDRINTLGNYEPSNCRWVTQDVQCKNRGSFNKIFSYDGQTMVLKDWARFFDIKYTTLYNRIYRDGMNFNDAINFKQAYLLNGIEYSLSELSDMYNIPKLNISDRLHKGWELIRALETPVRKR